MKYCEIQFRGACCSEERGVICQASGGCFGFRRQCAGVTHPPPLSGTGRLGRRFLEKYDWIFRFVSGRRYSDKRITCMSYISAPL